jgi:hypothetical protein
VVEDTLRRTRCGGRVEGGLWTPKDTDGKENKLKTGVLGFSLVFARTCLHMEEKLFKASVIAERGKSGFGVDVGGVTETQIKGFLKSLQGFLFFAVARVKNA